MIGVLLCVPDLAAQTGNRTGAIRGRVTNAGTGASMPNAEVQVLGMNVKDLTAEDGSFYLRNVPAGTVTVQVKYQGLDPITSSVEVKPDETVTKDLNFAATAAKDGTVMMDAFRVQADRFKSGQELAMNSERVSVNLKDVVSTDSLGYIPSGNVGEFVKYLPGVETNYGSDAGFGAGQGAANAASATTVSVRGFGTTDTAVTIDGVPVSGVSPGTLSRVVGLDMLSINSAARVEVIKVPTPDMPANSIGGVVNLVTKTAFEYNKPTYLFSVGFNMDTSESWDITQRKPGPANHPTYHTLPNVSANVMIPVKKNLGFSISVAASNSYSPNYDVKSQWQNAATTILGTARGTQASTKRLPAWYLPYINTWTSSTGTAGNSTITYNLGNTANGRLVDITNPYLVQVSDIQNPWTENRLSGSFKVDWKPWPWLGISANYTIAEYEGTNVSRRLQIQNRMPMAWGADFLTGSKYEPGDGSPHGTGALNSNSAISQSIEAHDKEGLTQTGYVKFNFAKGPWTIDLQGSVTDATSKAADIDNGHFSGMDINAPAIGQILMTGIHDGIPDSIQAFDRNGNVFDYTKLTNWTLDSSNNFYAKNGGGAKNRSNTKNVRLGIRRELDFMPFPFAIKIGGEFNDYVQSRSGRGSNYKFAYVGPGQDFTLSNFTDKDYFRDPDWGIGFANNQEWGDVYKMYDLWQQNPAYFSDSIDGAHNADGSFTADGVKSLTLQTANYRETMNGSRRTDESTASWYAMIDTSVWHNRVTIIAGVRGSTSRFEGTQPYINGSWNFVPGLGGGIYTIASMYPTGIKIDGSPTRKADGTTIVDWTTDTALVARMKQDGVYDHMVALLQSAGQDPLTQGFLVRPDPSTGLSATGTGTINNSMVAARLNEYMTTTVTDKTNPVTPSVLFSIKITDNIIFKPSYARETQLPPLDGGNGAAGQQGMTGQLTIRPAANPDPSVPGGEGTIQIGNPNLSPKVTDSFNFQLGWYAKHGSLTATYYYKKIHNDWITNNVDSTSSEYAAMIQSLGMDPLTETGWTFQTSENSDRTSNASGWEFSGRGDMGFLGSFMGHFSGFANYSFKKTNPPKDTTNVFGQLSQQNLYTWSAGIMFSYMRASLSAKMTSKGSYEDKNGGSTVNYDLDGDGVLDKVQLYRVYPTTYTLSLDFTYEISKTVQFFASGQNLIKRRKQATVHDLLGLLPSYAWVQDTQEWGAQLAAGMQVRF